jgi:hypothetical protein
MRKFFLSTMFVYASLAEAGIYCEAENDSCNLYIDSKGALIDRYAHKAVADEMGEVGMLAGVSVIKYGGRAQYAIVRESFLSDRSTLVVPLQWNGGRWKLNAGYSISISMMASSRELGSRWIMREIRLKNREIDGQIWDRIYKQFSDTKVSTVRLSRWPYPLLPVSAVKAMHSVHSCYLPASGKDGDLPIESIACRSVVEILDGGDYEFSGAVGTHAISGMSIHRQGRLLSGCYRYAQYKEDCIQLRGEIRDNGSISLREFAGNDGGASGLFDGAISQGKFSGEWRAAGGERTFPFDFLLQGFPD